MTALDSLNNLVNEHFCAEQWLTGGEGVKLQRPASHTGRTFSSGWFCSLPASPARSHTPPPAVMLVCFQSSSTCRYYYDPSITDDRTEAQRGRELAWGHRANQQGSEDSGFIACVLPHWLVQGIKRANGENVPVKSKKMCLPHSVVQVRPARIYI